MSATEQQEIDEAYMLEKGYHLKWPDGRPYRVRPFWFHDSVMPDFNNPEAVDWWMSKRAYLLDEMGVDGLKTDGGEHLWGREVVFANGLRGDEGLNLYPNLYVGAYHRFAREKKNGDALTFSRAGFTGAQAFPCHWAGDENSTWEAFRASLHAGLRAGLSGIPFWGWDIAGFSGEIPTAELYLRSAAMAAPSSATRETRAAPRSSPPSIIRTSALGPRRGLLARSGLQLQTSCRTAVERAPLLALPLGGGAERQVLDCEAGSAPRPRPHRDRARALPGRPVASTELLPPKVRACRHDTRQDRTCLADRDGPARQGR